ncbi:NADP-dependent D-sorbitol-6-phosphate dehydrogenase [Triticum aestivum]|uniref:NADP-dependent D-sorbitol-6-phosphate dehydrogenase n=1 Tax=Triticum aestivum TaxID=4565 RepID=UPI001D007967|nr:NADP-dependent D-sorbitol-6-phosphate dehydrogenase-like [Triticum aestivum]
MPAREQGTAAKVLKLSNGHEMPAVGLGVWRMDAPAIRGLIHSAIRAGYRHFDCAAKYQNEAEVGDALAEAFEIGLIKREDLFITTKVIVNY